MSAREAFVQAMESLLGMPVVWAAKGPDAYDCSGSVTACVKKVGGPDLRYTHNAQALHNATRLLGTNGTNESPEPGDLVFYGHGPYSIEHVAVYTADGGVISADGATSHITSLAVALTHSEDRVRRHGSVRYRSDTPYIAIHRNTLVDRLDHVER